MNKDPSVCDTSPLSMANEVTPYEGRVKSTSEDLNRLSCDPVNCCSSSSSSAQMSGNHCKQKSIATSTTTLDNLSNSEPKSSPECINSSCACRFCSPQDSDEGANSTSSSSIHDDPFDSERINVMTEILKKCLLEESKRPSANEICDRLSKFI